MQANTGPESFSGSYWCGRVSATFQPATLSAPPAQILSCTANCTLYESASLRPPIAPATSIGLLVRRASAMVWARASICLASTGVLLVSEDHSGSAVAGEGDQPMPCEIEHRHDDQHRQRDQQVVHAHPLEHPGDRHVEAKAGGVDGEEPRRL